MLPLGHGTVCFESVELCAFVLPLRLFFVKNFGGGARVWLLRSYLRGYLGAAAPRLLASFHWFCVVAVQARVCPGFVRLDIHFLRPGVWSLGQLSAFVLLPSTSFPWDVTVRGSCMSPLFVMLSVLFPGNIGYLSSESLVPS